MVRQRADVGVVGVGGMGSAAAYHLARRGLSVVGFEQFACAHDLGSSHGDSRIIREAYFEHPAYVPLVRRAYDLWEETEALAGEQLLTVCGGVMIGAPDGEVVSGTLASARRWGVVHEVLPGAAVRDRYPQLVVPDDQVGVVERRSGFVRPEASVRAHVDLAQQHGAQLHFACRVQGWTADSGDLVVSTDEGDWAVRRLVVTAGPWAGRVLKDLGLPLVIERVVMFWFEPDHWEDFTVGRVPIHLWDDPERRRLYGFPAHGDPAGGVKVAFYRGGVIPDVDSVDRAVADQEIEAMRAELAARVPGLAGRCVRAKVCLYTVTPDAHFIVGPHPGDERIVVAAGFSGHGFKFVPTIGEICADLVTRGRTDHDISLFSPARFA